MAPIDLREEMAKEREVIEREKALEAQKELQPGVRPNPNLADADDDLVTATAKRIEKSLKKEASNLKHMFSTPADGGPFGRN